MKSMIGWPIVISVLAGLAVLVVSGGIFWEYRSVVSARARENAENLLHAMDRDIARNIEVLGLSLQAAVEGIGRSDVVSLDPELRRLVLFDRSATAQRVGGIMVYDGHGDLAIDSSNDGVRPARQVRRRDDYEALRNGDLGLFVTRPYRSWSASEKWSSLMYGSGPFGGQVDVEEAAQARGDRHEAATG